MVVKTWTPTPVGDRLATTGGNWSPTGAPLAADDIYCGPASNILMEYDLPNAVNSFNTLPGYDAPIIATTLLDVTTSLNVQDGIIEANAGMSVGGTFTNAAIVRVRSVNTVLTTLITSGGILELHGDLGVVEYIATNVSNSGQIIAAAASVNVVIFAGPTLVTKIAWDGAGPVMDQAGGDSVVEFGKDAIAAGVDMNESPFNTGSGTFNIEEPSNFGSLDIGPGGVVNDNTTGLNEAGSINPEGGTLNPGIGSGGGFIVPPPGTGTTPTIGAGTYAKLTLNGACLLTGDIIIQWQLTLNAGATLNQNGYSITYLRNDGGSGLTGPGLKTGTGTDIFAPTLAAGIDIEPRTDYKDIVWGGSGSAIITQSGDATCTGFTSDVNSTGITWQQAGFDLIVNGDLGGGSATMTWDYSGATVFVDGNWDTVTIAWTIVDAGGTIDFNNTSSSNSSTLNIASIVNLTLSTPGTVVLDSSFSISGIFDGNSNGSLDFNGFSITLTGIAGTQWINTAAMTIAGLGFVVYSPTAAAVINIGGNYPTLALDDSSFTIAATPTADITAIYGWGVGVNNSGVGITLSFPGSIPFITVGGNFVIFANSVLTTTGGVVGVPQEFIAGDIIVYGSFTATLVFDLIFTVTGQIQVNGGTFIEDASALANVTPFNVSVVIDGASSDFRLIGNTSPNIIEMAGSIQVRSDVTTFNLTDTDIDTPSVGATVIALRIDAAQSGSFALLRCNITNTKGIGIQVNADTWITGPSNGGNGTFVDCVIRGVTANSDIEVNGDCEIEFVHSGSIQPVTGATINDALAMVANIVTTAKVIDMWGLGSIGVQLDFHITASDWVYRARKPGTNTGVITTMTLDVTENRELQSDYHTNTIIDAAIIFTLTGGVDCSAGILTIDGKLIWNASSDLWIYNAINGVLSSSNWECSAGSGRNVYMYSGVTVEMGAVGATAIMNLIGTTFKFMTTLGPAQFTPTSITTTSLPAGVALVDVTVSLDEVNFEGIGVVAALQISGACSGLITHCAWTDCGGNNLRFTLTADPDGLIVTENRFNPVGTINRDSNVMIRSSNGLEFTTNYVEDESLCLDIDQPTPFIGLIEDCLCVGIVSSGGATVGGMGLFIASAQLLELGTIHRNTFIGYGTMDDVDIVGRTELLACSMSVTPKIKTVPIIECISWQHERTNNTRVILGNDPQVDTSFYSAVKADKNPPWTTTLTHWIVNSNQRFESLVAATDPIVSNLIPIKPGDDIEFEWNGAVTVTLREFDITGTEIANQVIITTDVITPNSDTVFISIEGDASGIGQEWGQIKITNADLGYVYFAEYLLNRYNPWHNDVTYGATGDITWDDTGVKSEIYFGDIDYTRIDETIIFSDMDTLSAHSAGMVVATQVSVNDRYDLYLRRTGAGPGVTDLFLYEVVSGVPSLIFQAATVNGGTDIGSVLTGIKDKLRLQWQDVTTGGISPVPIANSFRVYINDLLVKTGTGALGDWKDDTGADVTGINDYVVDTTYSQGGLGLIGESAIAGSTIKINQFIAKHWGLFLRDVDLELHNSVELSILSTGVGTYKRGNANFSRIMVVGDGPFTESSVNWFDAAFDEIITSIRNLAGTSVIVNKDIEILQDGFFHATGVSFSHADPNAYWTIKPENSLFDPPLMIENCLFRNLNTRFLPLSSPDGIIEGAYEILQPEREICFDAPEPDHPVEVISHSVWNRQSNINTIKTHGDRTVTLKFVTFNSAALHGTLRRWMDKGVLLFVCWPRGIIWKCKIVHLGGGPVNDDMTVVEFLVELREFS